MKNHLCLLAALMLGGCVSMKSVPVSTGLLGSHQGQALTVVTYVKPDFVAMTQSIALTSGLFGAVGGAIGANVAIKNGNEIVVKDGISDPASEISAKLSPLLQDALKPSNIKTIADVDTKSIDEVTLSKLAENSGLVFDLQTVNWQFVYYPLSSHYRVVMAMRARLIDANTHTRLAQAPCAYASDDKDPPTYDEMLENNGARLKAMLAAATISCSDTMQKALLGN